MQEIIEKKTTGAAIILSAFMYRVLTGVSRLKSSAVFHFPGRAADIMIPNRIAAIRAPRVRYSDLEWCSTVKWMIFLPYLCWYLRFFREDCRINCRIASPESKSSSSQNAARLAS
jgi:hypothetical protein